MTEKLQALYSLLVLLLLLLFSLTASAQTAVELADEALIVALRAGGYNIYFRHAATDWSQQDRIGKAGDWISCDPARVRQLSNDGRAAAESIGKAIRALGIPIGKVLASPYCRTVETAQLMNLGPVQTSADIMNLRVAEYFGGRGAIIERARSRLATPPAPGTNTVLVAHGNVARAATPVYPGEGEAVVFHPGSAEGFTFIGRLTPAQWQQLAEKMQ